MKTTQQFALPLRSTSAAVGTHEEKPTSLTSGSSVKDTKTLTNIPPQRDPKTQNARYTAW